jgi:hypothetical protein
MTQVRDNQHVVDSAVPGEGLLMVARYCRARPVQPDAALLALQGNRIDRSRLPIRFEPNLKSSEVGC